MACLINTPHAIYKPHKLNIVLYEAMCCRCQDLWSNALLVFDCVARFYLALMRSQHKLRYCFGQFALCLRKQASRSSDGADFIHVIYLASPADGCFSQKLHPNPCIL